jgi:uncharacterized protein YndB with AHSA1/START domain
MERLELMLNGKQDSYPFGTEENDLEQIELREEYGKTIYDSFPELEAYHPLKLERVFHVSPQKLWYTLTDNDTLKKWYFDFKGNFILKPGQVFDWEAGPPEGKQWLHRGTMLEIIPNKKIVHTWEYPGYSGEAKLTWELEELSENKTLLKLIFEFITPFDHNVEPLRRKNFAEGWNHFMNVGIEAFLKGNFPTGAAT